MRGSARWLDEWFENVGVGLGHCFEHVARHVLASLLKPEPCTQLMDLLDDFGKVKDDTAKTRGFRPRRGAIAPVGPHRPLAGACK